MPKSKKKAKKEEPQVCSICERELSSEEFCKYHEHAYQNLMENYEDWQEAYGELTFLEYLQKIIENPATGVWAKDVAEVLLKQEDSKKGK
ncbi:MAG: hypothetical protein HWN65_07310 [Candidatus Helarchaeota archaeon]|nr:hypothetical protein [Candidatus Helarchaeota archaeon]